MNTKVINFESFLTGGGQDKFRYHLHDIENKVSHSLILKFNDEPLNQDMFNKYILNTKEVIESVLEDIKI